LHTIVNQSFPIFVNPRAGRGGEAERESLLRAFNAVGAQPSIEVVTAAELDQRVRAAAANGCELIGIAGGDGTLSTAANALIRTSSILLPVPLGTRNHFSQRYGIPTVEAAALAWQRSQPVAIHVGTVNQRAFINNASCGLYPHVVRHRERLEQLIPRTPAMMLAAARTLLELPTMKLELEIGEQHQLVRTPALWVGIGKNSLRMPMPGDAEVEGFVLEAAYGRSQTRLGLLRLAWRMISHMKRGIQPRDSKLEIMRAQRFKVSSPRAIDIALDGEPLTMRSPLEFALAESCLRVLPIVAPPT
jgi:diacylglycerol kinase family enzyme